MQDDTQLTNLISCTWSLALLRYDVGQATLDALASQTQAAAARLPLKVQSRFPGPAWQQQTATYSSECLRAVVSAHPRPQCMRRASPPLLDRQGAVMLCRSSSAACGLLTSWVTSPYPDMCTLCCSVLRSGGSSWPLLRPGAYSGLWSYCT